MLDLTLQPPQLSSRPPAAAGVCTDGSETLIAPGVEPENVPPRSVMQAKELSAPGRAGHAPPYTPVVHVHVCARGRDTPKCSARCPGREASKLLLSETKKACDASRGSSPCRDVVCVLQDVGTTQGFHFIPMGSGSLPPRGRKRKGRQRRGRTGLVPGTQESHVSSRETDFHQSQHTVKTACTPNF